MKLRRGYIPDEAIYPLQGLNTLDPSSQLDPHFSPDLLNVAINKGIISKRRGYSYLGAAFSISAVTQTDPVIGLVEYESLAGTKTLIAFTTKHQWKYDASGGTWTKVTQNATPSTGAGAETAWTGDETNVFQYAIVTGVVGSTLSKYLIATNGKDDMIFWDGANATFGKYSTGITDFKCAMTISGFYDRVVLGGIKLTTGAYQPNQIYYSEPQKLILFTGTGGGSDILYDASGPIVHLEKLGDRLMIYSQDSVHSMLYLGGATVLFSYERIMDETRLLSPRSVVNLGPVHIFMSQENAVLFNGTKLARDIGDRIYRKYRDELYASNKHYGFSFHDSAKRQVYLAYPVAGGLTDIFVAEYDTNDMQQTRWTRTRYTDRPTSMGYFSRNVDLTYDSAQFTGVGYESSDLSYDQGSVKGGFPVRVFGTSTGRVCLADDTVPNDVSSAFESYVDTKDFTVPIDYKSVLARWLEIELTLRGFEADVYVSLDEGETYEFVEKLELTGTFEKYRVPIDKMASTLRVRIFNNCASSNFAVQWVRVFLQSAGPNV